MTNISIVCFKVHLQNDGTLKLKYGILLPRKNNNLMLDLSKKSIEKLYKVS